LKKKAKKAASTLSTSQCKKETRSSPNLRKTNIEYNTEWPTLKSSVRRKGLTKDIATELVKNKRSGSVSRMAKRKWVDIVRGKKWENLTPIALSQQDQTNAGTQHNRPSWKDIACGLRTTKCNGLNRKREMVSPKKSAYSHSQGRCKVQSAKKYSTAVKAKNPPSVPVCGATKSKTKKQESNTPTNLVADSTTLEDMQTQLHNEPASKSTEIELKATSVDNNGSQRWCIDNMSVVYTKPVTGVISLKEPNVPIGNENSCNNKNLRLGDFMTASMKNKFVDSKDTTSNLQRVSSPTEICDLIKSISFHSGGCPGEQEVNSVEQKNLSKPNNHLLKANKKVQNQKRTRGEEDNKKVSLKYRALLKGLDGPLNVKAVSDFQTRSRKAEAKIEDMNTTRTQIRQQRQKRQERKVNEQRSPNRTSPNDKDIQTTQNNQLLKQGTSKDFGRISPDQQSHLTSLTTRMREKPDRSCDNKDINNSFYHVCTTDTKTKLPFSPSEIDIPEPSKVSSEPNLQHKPYRLNEADVDTIGDLDMDWWCTYLFVHKLKTT